MQGDNLIQAQFVSLILEHSDLSDDFTDSSLGPQHFEDQYRALVHATLEAHAEGRKLTRRSYLDFVSRINSSKKELAKQEVLFNRVNYLSPDRNDYNMLKGQIYEAYLLSKSLEAVKKFNKLRDEKGVATAVKQLAQEVKDLSESSTATKTVIYEDVNAFGDDYIQWLKDVREDKIEPQGFISTGFDELDKTSGVGTAPGTLTLFIGDVGGYKSLLSTCKITTYEKGFMEIGEVYEAVKSKRVSLNTIQLSQKSGKLELQPILDVFDHGVIDCFKITTRLGHYIDCTAKHRNLFFGGYKRTEEVEVGDRIAVARWVESGSESVPYEEAIWLGMMLAEGGTSGSYYSFSNRDSEIVRSMYRASLSCGVKVRKQHRKDRFEDNGRKLRGNYRVRGSKSLGKKYGLDGKLAVQKSVHRSVFSWNRESLSAMLRAMYSGDGRFHFEESKKAFYKEGERSGQGKRKYKLMYCTSSEQLVKDVRDLLLRFGLIASIYEFQSYYKKDGQKHAEGPSWRVELSDAKQIVKFIEEIGFIGAKKKLAEAHMPYLRTVEENPNGDTIPAAVWEIINRKFTEQGKSRTGCRRHYRRGVHEN